MIDCKERLMIHGSRLVWQPVGLLRFLLLSHFCGVRLSLFFAKWGCYSRAFSISCFRPAFCLFLWTILVVLFSRSSPSVRLQLDSRRWISNNLCEKWKTKPDDRSAWCINQLWNVTLNPDRVMFVGINGWFKLFVEHLFISHFNKIELHQK